MNEAMLKNLSPRELVRHVRDTSSDPLAHALADALEDALEDAFDFEDLED